MDHFFPLDRLSLERARGRGLPRRPEKSFDAAFARGADRRVELVRRARAVSAAHVHEHGDPNDLDHDAEVRRRLAERADRVFERGARPYIIINNKQAAAIQAAEQRPHFVGHERRAAQASGAVRAVNALERLDAGAPADELAHRADARRRDGVGERPRHALGVHRLAAGRHDGRDARRLRVPAPGRRDDARGQERRAHADDARPTGLQVPSGATVDARRLLAVGQVEEAGSSLRRRLA